MKVALVVDWIGADELKNGKLGSDSRTVRLLTYLGKKLKKEGVSSIQLFVASPGAGKAKAKDLKAHAPVVLAAIERFQPELVVALGKDALYAIQSLLPKDFPKTLKFKKLWGKVFSLGDKMKVVFTPSPAMLYASKGQEGGYLYLRTIQESILSALQPAPERPRTAVNWVTDLGELRAIIDASMPQRSRLLPIEKRMYGLDTETTGLNVVADKVRTIQFSWDDHQAIVVPFEIMTPQQWNVLFATLKARNWVPVMQNGKFDFKILFHNGVIIHQWHELSTAHVLVDEREGFHYLDFIANQVLGESKGEIAKDKLVGGPIDEPFIYYAGRDTDITRRAYRELHPVVRTKQAHKLLNDAGYVLAKGEAKGVLIDKGLLSDMQAEVDTLITSYQELFKVEGFNPKSPIQVKAALELEGKSDRKALLDADTELSRAIIDYRSLTKLKSSYLERIEAAIAADGRFHPDIRLAGPVTGRTSSGSGSVEEGDEFLPINSQNIPRPAMGQEYLFQSERLKAQLRSLFIADPGYVIVGADLATAEMRMAANDANDPVLIDDLNRKVDTHSLLTVMAYGLDKKHGFEIDLDNPGPWVKLVKTQYEFQRTSTKNATFATLYGGGLSAIATQAKCDLDTAKLIQDTIFSRYKRLKQWIDEVHEQIRTMGFLETRYGRRRIFPYSTGVFDRKELASMEREGQNYIIQADASDYALLGMVEYDRRTNFPVFNFVHDAIYSLVPEAKADYAKATMIAAIQEADKLPAVMYADAKYAQNWGAL